MHQLTESINSIGHQGTGSKLSKAEGHYMSRSSIVSSRLWLLRLRRIVDILVQAALWNYIFLGLNGLMGMI